MGQSASRVLFGRSNEPRYNVYSMADQVYRDYIIEFWPNRGKAGAAIKDMYERIVTYNAKQANGTSTVNGAPNGNSERDAFTNSIKQEAKT